MGATDILLHLAGTWGQSEDKNKKACYRGDLCVIVVAWERGNTVNDSFAIIIWE